jgi:hypothetical protein
MPEDAELEDWVEEASSLGAVRDLDLEQPRSRFSGHRDREWTSQRLAEAVCARTAPSAGTKLA